MTGENIVCFAKDWSEDPTSNNHVMRLLARENRVLWLNSIATRTPNLADRGDVRKLLRKLASLREGLRQVEENLWVYTPLVLPLPHHPVARGINRALLRIAIGRLRRRLGMDDFQLWAFVPSAADYVGTFGESLVVYYCVDDWSRFRHLDGPKVAAQEERLCRKADIVFATSRPLVEARRAFNPETHLALHGVDHATFSRALLAETPVPPELLSLPQPVIGFFGLLHEWRIDTDLLASLAERRPGWSFVLIGKVQMDTTRLERLPNVHILGRRPYETLPGYCKGFAAGIIPYRVDELTRNVNPIKLREYLSAGLPVVSTDLPETHDYREFCIAARDADEFLAGLDEAIRTDTPELRRRRSEAMRSETWERKVAALCDRVTRVKRKRVWQASRTTVPA